MGPIDWIKRALGIGAAVAAVTPTEKDDRIVNDVSAVLERFAGVLDQSRANTERALGVAETAIAALQGIIEAQRQLMEQVIELKRESQVTVQAQLQRGASIADELPERVLEEIAELAQPGTGLYAQLVSHAFSLMRQGKEEAEVVRSIRRGGTHYDDGWTDEDEKAIADAMSEMPLVPDDDDGDDE